MSTTTDEVTFDGRLLFLSDHADVMHAQLDGRDVTLEQALPLRAPPGSTARWPSGTWASG